MMSQGEIHEKIRMDSERLVALGVSQERQDEYYSQLSIDSSDQNQDQWAFDNATAGLNLSADELASVKRVFDLCDPR